MVQYGRNQDKVRIPELVTYVMHPYLFAFISYFGWGLGDVFGAMASRRIGAYATSFWVFALGTALFTFYVPFVLPELTHLTLPILLLNLFLGCLFVAGNVALNEALAISNASLVGTINASFTALTLLFSIVFLHEPITQPQATATLIVFAGIVLCTLDFREVAKGMFVKDRGIALALFALTSFATFFTFIKIPMRVIGWFWPIYISFLLFPFIYLFMRAKKIPITSPLKNKALFPILASALFLRFGDFSFNAGNGMGYTVIVAPIAGAYPTLYAVVSYLVFRDPLTRQQLVGIVTALIGIVYLSFAG